MAITSATEAIDSTPLQGTRPFRPNYRLLVSVLEGLHCGAAHVSSASEGVLIGADEGCDVSLLDEDVAGQAVRVFEQHGQLCADVRATGVSCCGMTLTPGTIRFDTPQVHLCIGTAVLQVELLRRSQRESALPRQGDDTQPSYRPPQNAPSGRSTALRQVASWAVLGLTFAIGAGGLAAIGGSVRASTQLALAPATARTLQDLLDDFNLRGAELATTREHSGQLLIKGWVPDAATRDMLDAELGATKQYPRVEVHDVRQMTDSLARLSRLANQACEPSYRGAGHFVCRTALADSAARAQLQAVAAQVPGVAGWAVTGGDVPTSQPLPTAARMAVAAAPAAPIPAASASVPSSARTADARRWPSLRHVAVINGERSAYDAQGRRLRVGDRVDGAELAHIDKGTVTFVRDGKRFDVAVAPLKTDMRSARPLAMATAHSLQSRRPAASFAP